MNDYPNSPNNPSNPQGGFDPNRPNMRKVKRPVKRMVPAGNNAPVPPRPQQVQQNQPVDLSSFDDEALNSTIDDNFDLDDFLDEEENVPVNLPTVKEERKTFNQVSPQFIEDEDLEYNKKAAVAMLDSDMMSKKVAIIISVLLFFVGFFVAKIFFSEEKVVRDGLQGVVINAEVPRGRARCGIAEKTQGCVLYIMNPQRQELNARDFYDLASQLTGRQRFMIETGNMRYSSVKIRPGEIAQLNIPPLQ